MYLFWCALIQIISFINCNRTAYLVYFSLRSIRLGETIVLLCNRIQYSVRVYENYINERKKKTSNCVCIRGRVFARCVRVFFISSITISEFQSEFIYMICTSSHSHRHSIMLQWIKQIWIVKSHVDIVQSAFAPCFASIVFRKKSGGRAILLLSLGA